MELESNRYDTLISGQRLRPTTVSGRELDDEMLSDKARVITSTAFRRLQVKAQVFSLEQNAAVRSRLTHTLEVALYGELIARKAATSLLKKGLLRREQLFPFVTVVQNACLLHDIGNPPFGHLGEFALRTWFQTHEKKIRRRWANHGLTPEVVEKHYYGLKFFDGNPQAIRIVTKLQRWNDSFGLNLSNSLIGAIVKYLDTHPTDSNFCKKAGFFETERAVITTIWDSLGLKRETESPMQRFPLAFLMEAADDIAYCLSDIEDAIEKGIVGLDGFFDVLPTELRTLCGDDEKTFIGFKTTVARHFVERAASLYVENHDKILNGELATSLLDLDSSVTAALSWLKSFARQNIFSSKEAIHVELSGFRIVTDLLDFFGPLVFSGTKEFQRLLSTAKRPPAYGELPLEQRMFSLLSKKHLAAYGDAVAANEDLEPVYRARLVVDYITGMTDTHALKVFRMLRGISAGVLDV